MKNLNLTEQKGIASLLVVAAMALLAVGIPVTTNLVQKNQENRSKAAENEIIPATGITMDLESPVYLGVGETLMMKYHLTPVNSTDKVTWSITKGLGVVAVDTNGLVRALQPGEADILGSTSTDRQFTIQNVVVTGKDAGQVDIFYNFREGNDYRVLTPGMDIVSELRLNTFGQALSSAEIVYYHTEALDPYLDGVTGTELTKVVSHKKEGGWQKLKVEFDKSKRPNDSVYVLKIKTRVVKSISNVNLEVYKGLSLSGPNGEIGKTEILNTDGKRMNIGQVGGTNFTIGVNPTAMPISNVTPTLVYPADPNDCRNAYSRSGCACTDGGITYNHGDKLCSHATNTCVICSEGKIVPSTECTQKCTGITPTEPVCGPINGQRFDYFPQKEILCKVGEASEVVRNKTTGVYNWTCALNGKKVSCLTKGPGDSNPYLTFDPAKSSHLVGETFSVTVSANSVSNVVSGVDVVGTYNDSNLELVSIKKASSMVFGTNGDCAFGKTLAVGKFVFTCFSNETKFDKAINGDLAVLSFKVKKPGEAKVDFVCVNGSNSDSNIIKSLTATDIIACNSNTNAIFTLRDRGVTIPEPPCVKKEGVSTFSVDTDCGNGNFRYMTFACYDGYKNREGGSTSCKSNSQWKIYADQYCQGRTNKCVYIPEVTEPPKKKVDGKCGTTRNSCNKGTLNDGVLPDSDTEYRWKCLGRDGGKTVNCRMEKQKKVNGRCGIKRNTCDAGSVNDGALSDTPTQYKWKCVSKNGGESVNCSSVKSNYSVR